MSDQNQRKFEIVGKIMRQSKELEEMMNEAEEIGIRCRIKTDRGEYGSGASFHHLTVDCLDAHLMNQSIDNQ